MEINIDLNVLIASIVKLMDFLIKIKQFSFRIVHTYVVHFNVYNSKFLDFTRHVLNHYKVI